MPDWKSVVRKSVGTLKLTPAQREEIIAELSDHLDDIYLQYLERGLSKAEAFKRSMEEVSDWQQLASDIQRVKRKESTMNERTKQFWLPTLVCLALSLGVLLSITTTLGRQGYFSSSGLRVFLVAYVAWLVLLPLCGAAGAVLSRRAGAGRALC